MKKIALFLFLICLPTLAEVNEEYEFVSDIILTTISLGDNSLSCDEVVEKFVRMGPVVNQLDDYESGFDKLDLKDMRRELGAKLTSDVDKATVGLEERIMINIARCMDELQDVMHLLKF